MIPFTLSNIAPILGAKLIGKDCTILHVFTDSRLKKVGENSLFVALKGKQFDACDFAEQAAKSGAVAFLVTRRLTALPLPQLIVDDTYFALGKLSAWVRQQIPVRLIALTGSSGKTSVKEMTASILNQCGCVLATNGNFNNNVGVPLTLLRLTNEHNFAVIELGANHPGEINWTVNLAQPETVLINNLSVAHLVGFGSLPGISEAKSEIFTGLAPKGCCILNADSHDWSRWKKMLDKKMIWRFSLNKKSGADFFASNIISNQCGVQFILNSPYGKCTVQLPLLGKHNIANALAASALAMSVGARLPEVSVGLSQMKAIPKRLFPIFISAKKILLDDSYNANVGSVSVAIQVLKNMPGYRVMVISDMKELGKEAIKYHKKIGKTITHSGIDKVLTIGNLSFFISIMSNCGKHFKKKSILVSYLIQLFSKHETITVLVKGSRHTKMEKIVQALQEKKYASLVI